MGIQSFAEGRVLAEVDEHLVGTLTLNRPDRHNAFDDDMSAGFDRAFGALAADDAVRCIVLRGEGPSFSGGRDLAVLGHRPRSESDFQFLRRQQNQRMAQIDTPKPVVAVVQGHALGWGFEVALAADIRLAGEDATFSLPEIRYGLLPGAGGMQLLTALAGPSRAKLMVMGGSPIDAATALAWGIVDAVHPSATLAEAGRTLARRIASRPPVALAMAKQVVDQFHGERVRAGMREALLAQSALYLGEDYLEARAALREKREPHFSGR